MKDPATGVVLAADHPIVVQVMRVWQSFTIDERRIMHRLWVRGIRTSESDVLAQRFSDDLNRGLNAS